ncbi:type VI secretion system-associated FHA domain protein TagH [Rubrimonas cliftonensis]|uniref:FHA domain protein n=1 Tax=Rubrimonas cliftonensis TaxID=89524 RepID=A0A1H4BGE3_9RHOB|nr:type VI secretion system-associated FHA domain protein TagH [Rubrimonas cliftonensis]SEA47166.1 FHA domain protein [Rubrimonas cliftonensis]
MQVTLTLSGGLTSAEGSIKVATLGGAPFTIGRSPDADWTLIDPSCRVSGLHLELRGEGDALVLVDRSSGGTALGDPQSRLQRGQPTALPAGGARLFLPVGEIAISVAPRRAAFAAPSRPAGDDDPFGRQGDAPGGPGPAFSPSSTAPRAGGLSLRGDRSGPSAAPSGFSAAPAAAPGAAAAPNPGPGLSLGGAQRRAPPAPQGLGDAPSRSAAPPSPGGAPSRPAGSGSGPASPEDWLNDEDDPFGPPKPARAAAADPFTAAAPEDDLFGPEGAAPARDDDALFGRGAAPAPDPDPPHEGAPPDPLSPDPLSPDPLSPDPLSPDPGRSDPGRSDPGDADPLAAERQAPGRATPGLSLGGPTPSGAPQRAREPGAAGFPEQGPEDAGPTPVEPAPARPEPPRGATQVHPAAPRPAASPDALEAEAALAALFDAMGLDIDEVPRGRRVARAREAGAVLVAMADALRQLLDSRRTVKRELGVAGTEIEFGANPLKFAPDAQAAADGLLRPLTSGYLSGEAAVADALKSLVSHQMALVGGIKTAMRVALESFDPETLEQTLERRGLSQVVPALRKAELWDRFVEDYARVADQADDDIRALIGRELNKLYAPGGQSGGQPEGGSARQAGGPAGGRPGGRAGGRE